MPSAAGTGDSAVPGMPVDQGEDDEDEEEDEGEDDREVEEEDEGAVCLFSFVVRSDDTISVCLNIEQTQLDPADAAPTRREQALEWQVRALLLVALISLADRRETGLLCGQGTKTGVLAGRGCYCMHSTLLTLPAKAERYTP